MEVKPSVLLDHSQSTLEHLEVQLSDLFDCRQKEDERALAARFAPLIRLDVNEPFRPLAAGYTIFREGRPFAFLSTPNPSGTGSEAGRGSGH